MGRPLIEQSSGAKALFERASVVLGFDMVALCVDGPEDRLSTTDNSQPAIFVTSLAAVEQLRERDAALVAAVQAAAGLSLGEYTAIVFADCLSFEDGLRLVRTRGEAMQAASNMAASGMVSVLGLDVQPLEQLCDEVRGPDEILQVANLLCPQNIVVSGHQAACDRLAAAAMEAGAMSTIPLSVAGAFHTPLMQPAIRRLQEALDGVTLSPAKIPVVSNVDGAPHTDPEEIRQLLIAQVVKPVHWERSIRWMLDNAFDQFFEIGPGRVLRGLLRRMNRKVSCENIPG
jgi:[acyl-carrier-protein] S-malonyltransferase